MSRTFRVASSLLLLGAQLLFVPAVLACEVTEQVDQSSVVPVIWNRKTAEEKFPVGARVVPHQHLNSELTVAFVENTKTALSYFLVPSDGAGCWKDFSALGYYQRNFSREIRAIRTSEFPEGFVMVVAGGTFESSLILAPRILSKALERDLKSYVVGIPARDLLFVADPANRGAVAALRTKVANAYKDSRYAISDKLFLASPCQISVLPEGEGTELLEDVCGR